MISSITRCDPVTEMTRMSHVFDRLFGTPVFSPRAFVTSTRELSVPLDVVEKEDKLVVRAAVPGVKPDELSISIEGNVLTIAGETKHEEEAEKDKVYFRECSYGSFTRSIRLPANLEVEKVDAEFANGFVTITLPKAPEEKPKVHKVQVRAAK